MSHPGNLFKHKPLTWLFIVETNKSSSDIIFHLSFTIFIRPAINTANFYIPGDQIREYVGCISETRHSTALGKTGMIKLLEIGFEFHILSLGGVRNSFSEKYA